MSRFTGFSRMFVLAAGFAVAISGCDKAEDVGRKVAHKSGALVGKGATEFYSGVGEERVAAVREILSIPDGYMPLNVIPVGYPAENPPAKDKWNPAKIHYDKW